MQKITRNSFLAAAIAAGVCAVGTWSAVRAQEKIADDHMKMSGDQMKMSPEQMKVAGEHMDKLKMMAADQPQELAAHEARLMVMDKMAMSMSMDPKFKQMLMQSMSDPNMKKVHDDAKKMADDPGQMARMQQDIMADPKAMAMVMHMAHITAMMHDSMMMHDNMMHDGKMKDMPSEKK
jgi:hypothetical protein